MAERIEKIFPGCAVQSIPVADGGEGSVDAFLTAVGGEKVTKQVTGPWFEQCSGYYGLIDNGATAVLEMAAAAGRPMVGDTKTRAAPRPLALESCWPMRRAAGPSAL